MSKKETLYFVTMSEVKNSMWFPQTQINDKFIIFASPDFRGQWNKNMKYLKLLK